MELDEEISGPGFTKTEIKQTTAITSKTLMMIKNINVTLLLNNFLNKSFII